MNALQALYELGEQAGRSASWFEDGQLEREGELRGSTRVGRWRSFWPDGAARNELVYVDGQLSGECSWWFENGRLDRSRSGVYRNGRRQP